MFICNCDLYLTGRGKMKKLAGPLMMALGAKLIAIVPILLGGLALFTAKALIVSKIAIVLAAIVALPSLFSGGGNLFSKVSINKFFILFMH